ncbi:BTAD domain-containing putative transcriptional regulator [Pseudarthrobacter enclensis]|uniref:AfsR/SARP family transcriptional regulator n=1 Tax=Pseudarthrobacter enclensis TaxID=993070 RepID=UPI00368AB6E3
MSSASLPLPGGLPLPDTQGPPGREAAQARLYLLNGFSLFLAGDRVRLPLHAQRVLAFLALARQDGVTCSRNAVVGRLWADSTVEHANGSLRTALWRIRSAWAGLVAAGRNELALGPEVSVDLQSCRDQAGRLLSRDMDLAAGDIDCSTLTGELLPAWDEDWLLVERERLRQLQLHALEALAVRLRKLGRYPEAIDAALRAVAIEPLRESVHAVLIDVCVDEGNVAAAHGYLRQYRALLQAELGLEPSPQILARFRTPATGEVRAPARAQPLQAAPSLRPAPAV